MTEKISIAEFKKLNKEGRVGKARNGDKAKNEMWEVIKRFANEGECDKELLFHPTRKWRFDFSIFRIEPGAIKIAIEFEGIFSEKSRHTTVTGFTEDCRKYNEAQMLGWIVLRYSVLNYKDLESDLNKLLK